MKSLLLRPDGLIAALVSGTLPLFFSITHTYAQSSSAIPDALTQWSTATRGCFLKHTPLECTQYYADANACLSETNDSPAILQTERQLIANGETPKAAARFAAENIGYPHIAALAARVPPTMTPQQFRNALMKDCLENVGQ